MSTSSSGAIPKNYFCKFQHSIKQQDFYTIEIFRYDQTSRYQTNEEIELKIHMISSNSTSGNTLREFSEGGKDLPNEKTSGISNA